MWSYHGVMSSIVIVLVVLLPQVSSSQPGVASHLMGPQLTGSCGEEVGLSRFRGLGFRGLGFRVLWGHQCDLLDCASKAELPSQVGPSCIDGRVPIFESCVAVSLEDRSAEKVVSILCTALQSHLLTSGCGWHVGHFGVRFVHGHFSRGEPMPTAYSTGMFLLLSQPYLGL